MSFVVVWICLRFIGIIVVVVVVRSFFRSVSLSAGTWNIYSRSMCFPLFVSICEIRITHLKHVCAYNIRILHNLLELELTEAAKNEFARTFNVIYEHMKDKKKTRRFCWEKRVQIE